VSEEREGSQLRVSALAKENFSADAVWLAEQSALLRGLAHALSNRVGTIIAVTGMLSADAPASGRVVGVLHDEGARLDELLGSMRVLGGEAEDAGPELLLVSDVVHPAVALHAHHPDVRDIECVVVETPLGVPARASHRGVTRAMLVLLTAAKRGASEGGVRLTWSETAHAVIVAIDGAGAGDDATAAQATALLGGFGVVQAASDGYRLVLPLLGASAD
jgi:hypothetical protein